MQGTVPDAVFSGLITMQRLCLLNLQSGGVDRREPSISQMGMDLQWRQELWKEDTRCSESLGQGKRRERKNEPHVTSKEESRISPT